MLSFQQLKQAIPVVLEAGHVPAIVGEAGIGKSALITDIATQMHAKLFTTVVSLSEKGDLAIPVPPLTDRAFISTSQYGELADIKFGYTHTLIEIIKWAEQYPAQPIIWFLDEFNRGSQAVQSELMNLVLQRQINSIRLPDQVYLILAENPDATMAGFETSDYGVTIGDAAINDRTVRLVMTANSYDWLNWAAQNDQINASVRRFIAENPNLLAPVDHDADLYPTPRAWQRVSDNLNALKKLPSETQKQLRLDLISGDLGVTVGRQFEQFLIQADSGLTVSELYSSDKTVLQRFSQAAIDQQQTMMTQLIAQDDDYPLTDPSHASRFDELLKLMPIDGQYAVILKISGVTNLLERLFESAKNQPAVQQLYDQITSIGLDGEL